MKTRRLWAITPTKNLSVRQKCEILGVNRSHLYYKPKPIDDHEVTLMNEIQDIYSKRPFQGYKRITDDLKDIGYEVNHKRVYRLMKILGLEAVYPKKNLSKRRQKDAIFSYLLKEFPPINPHDCWCVDITYLKLEKGFLYLTALIDVVSRCVVGWCLSPFLDTESCLNALEMAIKKGYKPKIINSDQGCQFTSQERLYAMALLGIRVSMDGKGRCLDNIPIERFWRTLKYEEVYLKSYKNVQEARENIAQYIEWYNHKRRHSGLDKNRPYEVMVGEKIASRWPFSKADGNVDNNRSYPQIHSPNNINTGNVFIGKERIFLSTKIVA